MAQFLNKGDHIFIPFHKDGMSVGWKGPYIYKSPETAGGGMSMERLTIKRLRKYPDESEYYTECEDEDCVIFSCPFDCPCEPERKLFYRLGEIEDILGNDYDLDRLKQLLDACKGLEPNEIEESKFLIASRKDPGKLARLRELVEADREGRCVVLHNGFSETAGGEALRKAMYECSVRNNEVTRYTADAIAEKVVRESESAVEAMEGRKKP